MDAQTGHIMNLANSIIGVSILAMPFCFHQCGIVLSIVLLLITSILSRLTCHFLLKSALLARRKNFEYLAFYIFGSFGKFLIEVGIIGFLLGSCIAFFVVMGDLGPEIISEISGTSTTDTMRTSILMALALFCVLPMGLLRNVDSLNGVSKATIGFYFCLILKILIVALPHLFSGDWLKNVILWRTQGILRCLPIFSMALSCQTQLFEIYQVVPNASLEKMNRIVGIAVNICTGVYICVGLFGYIAFSYKPFTGNILLSFNSSVTNSVIKIGFILSLAFSFPLVIFPCRASLYSLLYKGSYSVHDGVGNYIPEAKFKSLTLVIVFFSLLIGILIPNIETVLGLVGSTIGVMICVLFPVSCFICISQKHTSERMVAQIILFVGVIIMVMSTYANLYAIEKGSVNSSVVDSKSTVLQGRDNIDGILKDAHREYAKKDVVIESPDFGGDKLHKGNKTKKKKPLPANNESKPKDTAKEVRQEPAQPIEPLGEDVRQEPPQLIEPVVKEVRHEPPQPVEPLVEEVKPKPPQPVKPVVEEVKHELPQAVESVVEEVQPAKPVEQVLIPEKPIPKILEETRKESSEIKNLESPVAKDNLETVNDDDKIGDTLKVAVTGLKSDSKKQKINEKIDSDDSRKEIIEDFNKIEEKIKDNMEKLRELEKDANVLSDPKLVKENTNDKDISVKQNASQNIKPLEANIETSIEKLVKEEPIKDSENGNKKNDEVDIEAIKKEDKELKEQEKDIAKESSQKEKELIEAIKKQNEVQQALVEQQKKIAMVVMKNQDGERVNEEKLKAVKRIESFAKEAIEKLSIDEEKLIATFKEGLLNNQNVDEKNKQTIQNIDGQNKPIVNAAPLSYQLGLDQVNHTNNNLTADTKNKIPLPLPLVMSKGTNEENVQNLEEMKSKQDIREPVSQERKKIEADTSLNKKDLFEQLNDQRDHKKSSDKVKTNIQENSIDFPDLNKLKPENEVKINEIENKDTEKIAEEKNKKDEAAKIAEENKNEGINAIRRDILENKDGKSVAEIENKNKSKEVIKIAEEVKDEEINALRRDILEDKTHRARREINEETSKVELIEEIEKTQVSLGTKENHDHASCTDRRLEEFENGQGAKNNLLPLKENENASNQEEEIKQQGEKMKIETNLHSQNLVNMKNSVPKQHPNLPINEKSDYKKITEHENLKDIEIHPLLSDSKVFSPDLSLLDTNLLPVKPQSRDLKQLQETDK